MLEALIAIEVTEDYKANALLMEFFICLQNNNLSNHNQIFHPFINHDLNFLILLCASRIKNICFIVPQNKNCFSKAN